MYSLSRDSSFKNSTWYRCWNQGLEKGSIWPCQERPHGLDMPVMFGHQRFPRLQGARLPNKASKDPWGSSGVCSGLIGSGAGSFGGIEFFYKAS